MCYFTFVHHYKKVVSICVCSSTTVVFVSLLKDILIAIVENNEWIPWIYSWLVTNLHTSHNLSTCLKFPLSQPYMKGFRMTEVIAIMWQPENTRSTVLVTFNGSTCIFKTRWNVQWIWKCYLGEIWDIQKEIKDVHGWPHKTFETPYHLNRNLERGWLNNDHVPVNSNQQDGERGKVETAEFYHTFGFTQNILDIKSNYL